MSVGPVIPFSGYAGWAFLKRTQARQEATLSASPLMRRDETYFREKIGSIKTAEELVNNRRLLSVATTAFGLEGDLNNKYFLKKVLSDGTLDKADLSNRLADKRYLEFSKAFGFGDFSVPNTQMSDFADKIIAQYKSKKFESAVGETNNSLRLALNADRELEALSRTSSTTDTKWFTVMGNTPLRRVFETALGLPSSFASLDIDQQLSTLKQKSEKLLGDDGFAQFSNPAKREELIRTFLIRDDLASAGVSVTSRGYGALQILTARSSVSQIV